MARWFCFYLLVFIFLFNSIEMSLFKRHIGAAREYRYRAKHRTSNTIQQQQQQPILAPDYIRSRWIELYKERNKIPQT